MLPALFVVLERLPLSANGKLDRGALPAPDAGRLEGGRTYRAPETATERALAEIWGELLGHDAVGVDDDFFELGGHSLLATQVVSRVRERLSRELPLRSIFESPTIAAPRQSPRRRPDGDGPDRPRPRCGAQPAPPIGSRPASWTRPSNRTRIGDTATCRMNDELTALPLSFAQERLWFLDQLIPGSPAYTIFDAMRLQGPLDVEALRRSLAELVRRHEVLRSTFPSVPAGPSRSPSRPRRSRSR